MNHTLKWSLFGLIAAALLAGGCGKKDDEAESKTEKESAETASVKDFIPPKPEAGSAAEVEVAKVVLPDVAKAQNADVPELSPEVVAKAGILLDQTVSEMQDLSLMFMEIKGLDAATEAAPEITDKVKTLHAINEESKKLGVSEEQGRKYFAQKYATLKQMSALIQAHSQRLSHDVNIYRIVTEAWKEGQGPVEEGFLEARAQREKEEAQQAKEPPENEFLPGAEQPKEPERKRLREYRDQFDAR